MNESHRQNLLTSCAFAKTFIKMADDELRGYNLAPVYPEALTPDILASRTAIREEAQTELAAALRNLNQTRSGPGRRLAKRGVPMIVRFASICDKCEARSQEYSSWPRCRECDEDTCSACEVQGQADDESGTTWCKECAGDDDAE